MISESMFASGRRTIIEKRATDIVFIETMNKLEQEMLQTMEFQEAIREAIRMKGRALQPEDIFDYPVLKQHFMDYIQAMSPIMNFDIVVNLYQPLLYALAMQVLGNHHSAEDAVQESLMKAYIALKDFSKEQLKTLRLRPWLCKIVRNTAYNYRHRERRFEALDLSEENKFLEIEGSKFEQPEVELMIQITEQELEKLICSLPKKYRAIILLRFQEEYDYKELAQTLNYTSLGTLKSYLHRSLRLLRKLAEKQGISKKDLEIWSQRQVIHYESE